MSKFPSVVKFDDLISQGYRPEYAAELISSNGYTLFKQLRFNKEELPKINRFNISKIISIIKSAGLK
jgi:hypothetical protein